MNVSSSYKKTSLALRIAGVFLGAGVLSLVFSVILDMAVVAFIGLGLTFWGAILALTRNGKYVESTILDASAHSTYTTIDRILNDKKGDNHAYYIPAYANDASMPEYLKNLKDPSVYVSESFDGKPSIDELAQGKFSVKSGGFFLTSPGSGILKQVEAQLNVDLSQIKPIELCEVLPRSLTENLNLANNAQMTLTPDGASFKATGILYESLYKAEGKPESVSVLGCPVVAAAASALAKSSGKTVTLKELTIFPHNTVSVQLKFV